MFFRFKPPIPGADSFNRHSASRALDALVTIALAALCATTGWYVLCNYVAPLLVAGSILATLTWAYEHFILAYVALALMALQLVARLQLANAGAAALMQGVSILHLDNPARQDSIAAVIATLQKHRKLLSTKWALWVVLPLALVPGLIGPFTLGTAQTLLLPSSPHWYYWMLAVGALLLYATKPALTLFLSKDVIVLLNETSSPRLQTLFYGSLPAELERLLNKHLKSSDKHDPNARITCVAELGNRKLLT